jgi:hypothetical protein
VNINEILAKIGATEAPLARQLLMIGLITRRLVDKGKPAPVLIGGLALSYYTREVYFTADIDLAYADREALDEVLRSSASSRKAGIGSTPASIWPSRRPPPRWPARTPSAKRSSSKGD